MEKYKQKNMNKWLLLFFFSCLVNDSAAQDKEYLTIEVWKNGIHKNFYGTNIDSITITPTPEKPITDPYNGYSFVDMGLPSGTLWASCNVGASDPLSPGVYVSWAELDEKDYYSWENTKYFDGSWHKQTKYCTNSNHGKVDNIMELEYEDDIAYAKWGKNWRIPSEEDFKELKAFCSWTFDPTLPGFKVRASNDNYLYFPITGYKAGKGIESFNMNDSEIAPVGAFWTRDLVSYSSDKALAYVFSGIEKESFSAPSVESSKYYRYYGCTVRPVTYWSNKEDSEIGYVKIWNKGDFVKLSVEQIDSMVFHYTDDNVNFIHNGYEYVDLGLPSGVMWASRNIGADSIKGHGDYFAWGEICPKDEYNWDTYSLGNGKHPLEGLQLDRYCLDEKYGFVDDTIELSLQDDAAYMNWGQGWRTPSFYDIYELVRYCKRKEIRNSSRVNTLKGLPDGSGVLYTGPNGNSIFIPAAGYKMEKRVVWINEMMAYWLNQLISSPNGAYYYDSFGSVLVNGKDRCYGMPIRPVMDFMKAGNIAYEKDYSSDDCMYINSAGEENMKLWINSNPIITYNGGKIQLKTSSFLKDYELSNSIKILFDDSMQSSINNIINDNYAIVYKGGEISITDIKDTTVVSLFKSSGEIIQSQKTNKGAVKINISNLKSGDIYILKIGNNAFKFIKK